MLGTTTLELSAILVVVVGAAAGVAVSLVARRQRSLQPDRVSMQVKSEATDSEDSGDFLDFDSDPVPAVEHLEESGEPTTAPAVVSTPAVSSFQASMPGPQQIQTTTFGSDQIATEPPAPQAETTVFESKAGGSNQESQISPPIPIADESPVVASATKEEEARISHSEPIAMPTDSAAIENMTPAPAFPVALQAASLGSIAPSSGPRTSVSAYCVKCKSKKQMKDPTPVTMKNGRPAVSGFCCDCGTRVFRIGKISAF